MYACLAGKMVMLCLIEKPMLVVLLKPFVVVEEIHPDFLYKYLLQGH